MKRTKTAALESSTVAGDIDSAKELIESHGKQIEKWTKGYDILCKTIDNKHQNVALMLINSGVMCKSSKKQLHNTPLHLAVVNNDQQIVELLLKKHERSIDINAFNKDKLTPLYLAVDKDYCAIAKILVESKANTKIQFTNKYGKNFPVFYLALLKKNKNMIDIFHSTLNDKLENGKNVLQVAVENKNSEIADQLLIKGANTINNYCDENGDEYPILHLAVRNDDAKMVETLLQYYNIRTNAKDHNGKIPLVVAFERGNVEVMKHLIAKKAETNVLYKTESGETHPLLYLSVLRNNPGMVDALLRGKWTKINYTDKNGKTPFMIAFENRQIDIIKLFVRRKYTNVNLNVTDNEGDEVSLLNFAFQENDKELIELLLKQKHIKVDNIDKQGKTPILIAFEYKDTKLMRKLIHRGADVNKIYKYPSGDEYSLLYTALCKKKYKLLVSALLSSDNIDPNNFTDKDGKTAFILAYEKKDIKVMMDLIQRKADVNLLYPNPDDDDNKKCSLLYLEVLKNNEDMVQILLSSETIKVDFGEENGKTPFILAYERKNLKLVELLIEKGADVNVKYAMNADIKYPLLYLEVLQNNEQMVELLLKSRKVKVDLKENNKTALFIACENRYLNVISKLIERGADVNMRYSTDDSGYMYTLLYLALDRDAKDVSILLLEQKNSNDPQGSSQITPLQLAIMKKYYDVIDKMLKQMLPNRKISLYDFKKYDEGLKLVYNFIENLDDPEMESLFSTFKKQRLMFLIQTYSSDKIIEVYSDSEIVDIIRNLWSYQELWTRIQHLFMMAIYKSRKGIVEAVIQHGLIDVSFTDCYGNKPIHEAAKQNDKSIMELLVINGAEVNSRNKRNENALQLSVQHCNEECFGLLLDYGTDVFNEKIMKKHFQSLVTFIFTTHSPYMVKIKEVFLKFIIQKHNDNFVYENRNDPELNSIMINILNDIEKLRNYRIGESYLTLYTFLKAINNTHQLVKYITNPEIDRELESINWDSYPSMYSGMIGSGLFKAKQRKQLLNKLYSCQQFNLPDIPLDKIFSYLNEEGLQKLIKAHSSL